MKRILICLSLIVIAFFSAVGCFFIFNDTLFKTLLVHRQFKAIEWLINAMDDGLKDPLARGYITGAFESMGDNPNQMTDVIESWCKKDPQSYIALTTKGELHLEIAWRFRGGGWASTVSEAGWKKFQEHLLIAEQALTRAYKLNPDAPFAATKMITVSMGLCKPREEMEKWFHRATRAKTTDPSAYACKELYLQPKWHGTLNELLDFVYALDKPESPPLVVATAYGEVWYDRSCNEQALLANETYLKKTTQAYTRSLKKYPYRRNQRFYCAFFAMRTGNYTLAAKQFNLTEWTDSTRSLQLWKTQEAYEADRSMAFKNAFWIPDQRLASPCIIATIAGLFYIPTILLAFKQRRSWRDTLFIGGVLVFLAFRTNTVWPYCGTILFVAIHIPPMKALLRTLISIHKTKST